MQPPRRTRSAIGSPTVRRRWLTGRCRGILGRSLRRSAASVRVLAAHRHVDQRQQFLLGEFGSAGHLDPPRNAVEDQDPVAARPQPLPDGRDDRPAEEQAGRDRDEGLYGPEVERNPAGIVDRFAATTGRPADSRIRAISSMVSGSLIMEIRGPSPLDMSAVPTRQRPRGRKYLGRRLGTSSSRGPRWPW